MSKKPLRPWLKMLGQPHACEHGRNLKMPCGDDFIPSWPDDFKIFPINRVIGEGQIVDELRLSLRIRADAVALARHNPDLEKNRPRRRGRRPVAATNSLLSASIGTTLTSCVKWAS